MFLVEYKDAFYSLKNKYYQRVSLSFYALHNINEIVVEVKEIPI